MIRIAVSLALAYSILPGQGGRANQAAPLPAPFTVAVNTTTIEAAPVYVADHGPSGVDFEVANGGVRNLANGTAHAATNAETQMLILGDPKVRLLMTVAEGLYRVVAKRSAGIRSVADLRGKRITVPRDTSAHYYLVRTLARAGIGESEVALVDLPRNQMAAGVVSGQADAISMWEPEAQKAVDALGGDAVVFQDTRLYRELFSLYTTTDVLSDPRRHQQLVTFVRALIAATDVLNSTPQPHFAVIARTIEQAVERVVTSWPHHRFPAALPADLLDVMVEEEQWVARNQRRTAHGRAELARLIDASVLAEARGDR